MTRPAVTSKRVAAIAGLILEIKGVRPTALAWFLKADGPNVTYVKWSDIRALAASALTQAADKPKRGKWTARKIAMRKK